MRVKIARVFIIFLVFMSCRAHGPLTEKDEEDVLMGRKSNSAWCRLARGCAHAGRAVCGVGHATDIVGFRDLCDMADYNCVRRRDYRQTPCPEDMNTLVESRASHGYND